MGGNVPLDNYRNTILQRFGNAFDDSLAEIKNVRHVTTIEDYQNAFDKPQSLAEAYHLSKVQEATIKVNRQKYKAQLLPTPSAHNFMDTNTTKKMGCMISANVPLQVDGNKLISTSVCKKFTWQLHGEIFETNAMLIPLGGCKMVLGVQWLAALGNIQWNFSELRMAFEYKGKTVTLRGTQKSTLQWMQGKKLLQLVAELSSMMLCVYPVSSLIHSEEDILRVGAELVHVKGPYMHPPKQKEAIENEEAQKAFTITLALDANLSHPHTGPGRKHVSEGVKS
ncbi:retrotransposable element Tf2 [Tanacetum coccineum]